MSKKKTSKPAEELVAGHLAEVEPNKPVQIMPWGEFDVNGKKYRYTEESIPLIRERIAAHGVDLPIDYEHGTSTNPPATGVAVAAGWLKPGNLTMEPGEPLRALPEWTPAGARHVQAREFRYLSPSFYAQADTGLVVALHSVALTNKPAIAHMPPIAAAEQPGQAEPETQPANPALTELLIRLRTLLKLSQESPIDEIIETLKTAEGMRPIVEPRLLQAELDAAKQEVIGLRGKLVDAECTALISSSAHAGKVPPADQEWFRGFYRREPGRAREWLDRAPKLVRTVHDAPSEFVAASGLRDPGAVIAAARREYKQQRAFGGIASERAFVSERLVSAGFGRLSVEAARERGIPIE